MASTSNAYDFDLFDSRDHGSAAPKLPEPKAPQKQKQKNNVVKLDEKQLRRSHRHSANTVKMLMNLAVVLVIVWKMGLLPRVLPGLGAALPTLALCLVLAWLTRPRGACSTRRSTH